MNTIIPGILEPTWIEVERKIKLLSPFAHALHIDVIDGRFANNLTFLDPRPFAKYKDQFLLEVHLMVEEPINYILPFARAGFRRFIGHIEKMESQEKFVKEAKLWGEVGLALDGPTPLNRIRVNYSQLDLVHFYVSKKVGFSGPPMLPQRLEKVKALRAKTDIPIEVDGGVKDTTIENAQEAGATYFVATSFISGSQNPMESFEILNRIVLS